MRRKKHLILIIYALWPLVTLQAQDNGTARLTQGLIYGAEAQISASNGLTPLWLNANKHGLSSLEETNGYLRATVERPLQADSLRQWALGYAADVAVPFNYTSHLVVQQLYAEARWKSGVLTVGSKEQPMELKNNLLSSGSQTLGINARPVPQVRLALPDYWTVPVLGRWFHLKGHIAYGMMTDDKWQHDFTRMESKYTDDILFHSKAGYLKIGKDDHPFSAEFGAELAMQFGGKTFRQENGQTVLYEGKRGLGAFIDALFPTEGESYGDEVYSNVAGNNLGSWMARLNYDRPQWRLSIYGEHFFEDHSGMLQIDYDGYGTGDEWNVKKDNRYFLYDLKDIMLGAELNLKQCRWLSSAVVEYIYTKYQSGPVYHDHSQLSADHISGRDDYYNHGHYPGWQHWGQVMGNPLYRSPIYNDDHEVWVADKRFSAWHLAAMGAPTARLSYRAMLTWQTGLGTYNYPYTHPHHNFSMMAEATCRISPQWALRAAYGMDRGSILGNNQGAQITVIYKTRGK